MALSREEKERILRAIEEDREFRYALMASSATGSYWRDSRSSRRGSAAWRSDSRFSRRGSKN